MSFGFLFFTAEPGMAATGDEWVLGADSPVTTETHEQYTPAISGDLVVWVDYRPGPGGRTTGSIYYKYLSQNEPDGHPLIEERSDPSLPAIQGDLVVWSEYVYPVGRQIFYMRMGDSAPTRLSPTQAGQGSPAVFGTKIVWSDSRSGTADIYLKDIAPGGGGEQVVCADPDNQGNPAIFGDWVAWVDKGAPAFMRPTRNDIFAMNLSTGEVIQVTNDGKSVIQDHPALGGDTTGARTLVYNACCSSTEAQSGIWAYDLRSRVASRIPAPLASEHLRIDNDKVVWNVWAGPGKKSVSLYDLGTQASRQVSDGSSNATAPDISAGHIIWQDDRNGNADIYQNQVGETAQTLADRFAPELHFRHDINTGQRDDFEPRTVELLVDVPGTRLVTAVGENDDPVIQTLSDNPEPENYLDLPGSPYNPFHCYNDDYLRQLDNYPERYQITTYARIIRNAENTNKTVIQYWMLYYYNNWYNNHEGDWEMVEVILDQNLAPESAAYSQHGRSEKKYWNEDGFEKSGTHPKVYVAEGSHANMFDGGYADRHFHQGKLDLTGSTSSVIPAVDLQWSPGGWADYAGLWGEKEGTLWPRWAESGPPGPQFQPEWKGMSPWREPLGWADPTVGGSDNDTIITAHGSAEIHLYDVQGNHVGEKNDGGVDRQIPRAEYFERSEDDSKNIVVHDVDISGNFRLEITGKETGTETTDLEVQTPDFSGGIVNSNKYLSIQVSATIKNKLDINTSRDFALQIDTDGDGVYEGSHRLDVSQPLAVDFTPPTSVTNLDVESFSRGTATLSWSSPGDDGNQGTATRYDLRYATAPVTEASWNYATIAGFLPDPQAAGTVQTATIEGLDASKTYYFAIRALDDAWQPGPISNVVTATTAMPGLAWSKQRVYWSSWADYQDRQLSIDYMMNNTEAATAINSTIQASFCNPNIVHVTTSLPLAIGNIGANDAEVVTLKYFVPETVVRFTTTTYANCTNDAGKIIWFPGPLP
jgi:beta propeller repeat protein